MLFSIFLLNLFLGITRAGAEDSPKLDLEGLESWVEKVVEERLKDMEERMKKEKEEMDKVSGLKSILRVVLPAGAVPKSDLISAAVSELDLIFFTIFTQPQQPARWQNHPIHLARSLSILIFPNRIQLARSFSILKSAWRGLFVLNSLRGPISTALTPAGAVFFHP